MPRGGSSPLLLTQVIGHSNFGTIRSTTCVYKGEAMLHCGPGAWEETEGPGLQQGAVSLPAGPDLAFSREMGLRGAHLLPGAHADWLVHHQLPLQSGGTLGGRWPSRGTVSFSSPPDRVRSAQDPHPTASGGGMCPVPCPPSRATQLRTQPSLLPSERQPPSLEPCGSKVGGWWALAPPLPTSPGPHRPSSPGGSWRHTQLLCL